MPLTPPRRVVLAVALTAMAAAALVGCGGAGQDSRLSQEASLGQLAFNEPLLSASGRLSCASCHAADNAHGASNALAVQAGGARLEREGLRASQSLRYLAGNGAFHFGADGKPAGGFFWDGRADSLALQAGIPLLGQREMANSDKSSVVAGVARTDWADQFKALYGADILDNADRAFDRLTQAFQRFQLEDASFNAFTSKYDHVLRSKAELTTQEARGLALFNQPAKGNCASCHPSAKAADGSHPLFTDFSYDNLGIPRNPEVKANSDPAYFDLGLCDRPDLRSRTDLCGAFKVPSLRNVALRQVLFHNGRFKSLKQALTFYVQRDTAPEKWYPRDPDGSIRKFDDLPSQFHSNVNVTEVPYDRKPGASPALDDGEIDDVIAFLRTLTDGWTPP